MRLKPSKVSQLSEGILKALHEDENCQFIRDDEQALETIRETFLEDLRREDRIDEEIWEKLDANADKISNRQMNRGDMFQQAKRMIAKQRRLVF